MGLPRIHSFEFNDHPKVPVALRGTVVETLGNTLHWGRIVRGMVPAFLEFLKQSKSNTILDLASGAGMPARILTEEIIGLGKQPPNFYLTDLFPNTDQWEPICKQFPSIQSLCDPLDATQIPPAISENRARVIINAFHHFPPSLAQGVVNDAIEKRAPLFIAEGFQRNPLQFLNFIPMGMLALYANPLLTRSDRLAKALWTWPLPLAGLVCAWDGFVSTLRVYSQQELRAMVAGSEQSFDWVYGTYKYPLLGTGYYFYGVPK